MSDNNEPIRNSHPVVLTLPYLKLAQPITFDGWWLGPSASYTGTWLSDPFELAARQVLGAFRDVGGSAIEQPALLVRAAVGADGALPSRAELEALRLALAFATVDQNRYWSPGGQNDAWSTATTDNAVLWIQPIDVEGHWISLGQGARVHIMAGGYRFTDPEFFIPSPLELHLPFGISLDPELVGALYKILLSPPAGQEHLVSSLRVAIRWLLKSWQNTPSITWEDRLVYVKVATEALTGEEGNAQSAARLASIFAGAIDQEGEGIGIDDLLWSPDEPKLTRTWTDYRSGKEKSAELHQFEHWACALGDARNALVHGEDGTSLTYDVAGSPYAGPFVEIGDRVVREAIAVLLGECGYPALWRRGLARASFQAYQMLRDAPEEEG